MKNPQKFLILKKAFFIFNFASMGLILQAAELKEPSSNEKLIALFKTKGLKVPQHHFDGWDEAEKATKIKEIEAEIAAEKKKAEARINLVLLLEDGDTEVRTLVEDRYPGATIRVLMDAISNRVPIIASSVLVKIVELTDFDFSMGYAADNLKNNYHIYINQAGDFCVLIPIQYVEQDLSKLGFKSDLFHKIDSFGGKFKTREELSALSPVPISINHLKDIFNAALPITKRIYLMGHGGISGTPEIAQLSKPDYQALLSFFNTIHVTFLYVTSCYAGGLHMMQWHQFENDSFVNNVPLDFPIVVGALTDAPTTYRYTDYAIFFEQLDAYFSKRGMRPWHKTRNVLGREMPVLHVLGIELENAIATIWGNSMEGISKKIVPSIRFPGIATTFKPMNLSSNINIINYPLLLAYELDKAPRLAPVAQRAEKKTRLLTEIEPLVVDGNLLLLYPSIIRVPLLIKKDKLPHIVSMIPGRARHFIEKLIWDAAPMEENKITIAEMLNNPNMHPHFVEKPVRNASPIEDKIIDAEMAHNSNAQKIRHFIEKLIWNTSSLEDTIIQAETVHNSHIRAILNTFIGLSAPQRPKLFFIKDLLIIHGPKKMNYKNMFVAICEGDERTQVCRNEPEIRIIYQFENIYRERKYKLIRGDLQEFFYKKFTAQEDFKLEAIMRWGFKRYKPAPGAMFEATGGRESDVQFDAMIDTYFKK